MKIGFQVFVYMIYAIRVLNVWVEIRKEDYQLTETMNRKVNLREDCCCCHQRNRELFIIQSTELCLCDELIFHVRTYIHTHSCINSVFTRRIGIYTIMVHKEQIYVCIYYINEKRRRRLLASLQENKGVRNKALVKAFHIHFAIRIDALFTVTLLPISFFPASNSLSYRI